MTRVVKIRQCYPCYDYLESIKGKILFIQGVIEGNNSSTFD